MQKAFVRDVGHRSFQCSTSGARGTRSSERVPWATDEFVVGSLGGRPRAEERLADGTSASRPAA
ncbi:hypothetical protein DMJ13_06165 [halophilic archaeon]|nr:hypothetical protein DMJ13_06165 [halophilic archaeon]